MNIVYTVVVVRLSVCRMMSQANEEMLNVRWYLAAVASFLLDSALVGS